MAVSRKGKEVVEGKAASVSAAAAAASPASSSGGKRKRPLSAAGASAFPPSSSSSRGGRSRQKKMSRGPSRRFIDDEAVDAGDSDEFDEDEDEDDDEDEDGDFSEEEPEFTNDIQAGVKVAKGAGKTNFPLIPKVEDMSGDALEEFINRQYDDGSDHVMYDEDDKKCDDRKSLVHSTDNPTIWKVKCMAGYERHIAFCLIQKYVSLHVRGSNLPIISVFALEHIKGHVYIEADKQRDVAEACKGFPTLYTSKISLVPTNEVPRLLSIQNKSSEIAMGTWVRMKNGKYKGDLAQIVAVDAVRKKATVKLVPRIDLQALAKKFGGGISLKHAAIPAPRLIRSQELEDFKPHIEIRHDRETGELFEILDGLMLKDGYLYKKVSVLSLNCFGVQPSSAELVKFEPAKSDEPQVSEYISQLYGGRKRNSSETLDDSLEDKGNSFKLHDLVLFGQKDFGVIIGMKCGNFQILKGGVEEPAVITVQRREIKKSCIDKVFTAPDSHAKTICINDAVKVLEGPQKDRQGIVKHMFKGTLFVYDEEITENTGFFCVNCKLCELTKDGHKNMGYKSCHFGSKGTAEFSSMPQSPTRCFEQRDCDNGFKRYREGDRDQPFTVGQKLRIRVGPMKGYLCRVVRIYRSDVTVKLDSLVKLITVNCNHLSATNIKNFGNPRDDTISKPDEFGSVERLSKGELVDGDTGEPSSKSSWDFELPSSSRASLLGLSSWGSSSANCDDNKGNDQGDDPWGSKVTSGNGCQAGHSDDAEERRSQPATTDGWSNWTKAEKPTEGNDQAHDPWGSKVTSVNGCQTRHSGYTEDQRSQPATADGWSNWTKAEKSTEGNDRGDDPWGSKINSGNGCQVEHSGNAEGQRTHPETANGWSNLSTAEKSTEGAHETWKCNNTNEDERSGWSQAMSYNHGQADKRNRGAGASGESNDKGDWAGYTDRSGCLEAGQGFGSNEAKATTDGWGNQEKAEKSTEEEHKSWNDNSTSEGETGGWSKGTSSNHGQADNWCRGTSNTGESDGKSGWGSHNHKSGHSEGGQGFGSNRGKASTDGWSNWDKAEKGNITNECEKNGWNKAMPSNCGQTDNWNGGAGDGGGSDGKGHWGRTNRPGHFEVGQGSGSSWGKAATDGWRDWNKAGKSTEDKSKSGKANDTSEGEIDGWRKAMSSNHDQGDGWNKGAGVNGESNDKVDWGGCSGRSAGFEGGQSFGYGRGTGNDGGNVKDTNQGGGWSRRPNIGGDYGFSWGRGGGRNSEAYGSGDKQDSWNRSRDSDDRQVHGRGRGFYGSGRGRNQDDSLQESCSDAGWSSGRGRGRGRRGRGVWEARGSRADYNDSSHSGRDGNNHSFGWKYDRGSSSHGDFSGDALPSWKSDQSSGWGTSTTFGNNEAFDAKKDKNHGWGEKEPFAGGSSGWNSGRGGHSATRHEGASWERNEKPNINQGCISNSGWDTDKLAVAPDKHVDGEQPENWQKEATNKWGSPEECKNKQSSWSAHHREENATDEDWSIKPKPLMADQSGDTSASPGLQSSAWASKSSVNEVVGKEGGSGGNWDRVKESGKNEESTWGTDKRKDWNSPEDGGNQHGARSSVAAGDNWEKGNRFPDSKDGESGDWHTAKTFGGSGSSVWGQKSSRDGVGKDAGGGAGSWDNQRPNSHGRNWSSQEFGGGNWNRPDPSGGKQDAEWHDDGGNWNRSKEFGGRHASGRNNWSAGDGERRNDDRSGDWSGGKSYGVDGSSRWRGNMSSGRGNGRGRGKGFGQEQASGWSGGVRSSQEAGGADFSFSDRQESHGRSKPTCWTHDAFADNGSGSRGEHSGWSRGKNLAVGQSDGANKGASGEEGWRQETKGLGGSWDSGAGNRATGSGTHSDWNNSSLTSGWTSCAQLNTDQSNAKASAWNKAETTSQDGCWEQKKCLDAAQATDGWKSDAIPSQKASAEACQGTDNWKDAKGLHSDATTGWNSASTSTEKTMSGQDQAYNQKVDPDRAKRPGGWGSRDASGEEPGENRTQRDTWSQENPRDRAHGSGDGSGWERSKDESAGKGGW